MKKYWKIYNSGKIDKVKIAIAVASDKSPGFILEQGDYVVSLPRMTTMLDAQEKRGFVTIERDFENKENISLGEVRKASDFEQISKKVENYKNV